MKKVFCKALMLFLTFMLVFVSCKRETGLSQGETNEKLDEFFSVSFDKIGNGEITATVADAPISLPYNAKKDTIIKFIAKPDKGYEVGKWEGIKDEVQTEPHNVQTVTIKVQEGINVVVVFKRIGSSPDDPSLQVQIEFSEQDIKCTKGGVLGFGATNVSSGENVDVGTALTFTTSITGTTTVKSWLINGKRQENQTKSSYTYTVKEEDAQDGKIRIGVEFNKGYPIVVKFSQNITCSKGGLLGSTNIPSNSNVEIGNTLTFTGTPSKDKVIDKWLVNGAEKGEGTSYSYTVNADDGKLVGENLILEVSFSEREPKKFKVQYDVQKTQCNEPGNLIFSGKPIPSGSFVAEGSNIVFSAKKGKHEDVKEWFVKGIFKQKGGDKLSYTVDAKDADGNGVIDVSWTISYQIKIEFDKNRVKCVTKALVGFWETEVISGSFHSEGTKLYLYPKLKEGEVLKKWLLNDKPYNSLTSLILDNIIYDVSNKDAIDKDGDRYIKISTQTEQKTLLYIRFNDTKLECKHGDTTIKNNDHIFDQTKLVFTSKLPEGTAVSKWLVNGQDKSSYGDSKRFEFTFYEIHAKDESDKKIIDVTIEEKQTKKVSINFDDSQISCQDEKGGNVASGTAVYEESTLTFTAKIGENMGIANWQFGKQKLSKADKTVKYVVKLQDATESVGAYSIDVSYVVKEKLAIKFDARTILCEISDGAFLFPKYTSVQNGELVDEDSFLRFTPVTPDQTTFSRWLVNGKDASGNKNYKTFSYTVLASDGVLVNGTKEIVVSIETK